jgi:hypothetical protein
MRLGTFVDLFTKRRDDFVFEMTVRTAIGIEDINQTVRDVEAEARKANERSAFLHSEHLVSSRKLTRHAIGWSFF